MAEAGSNPVSDDVVTSTSIETLPKIATGKVRELYKIDGKTLLFVASDRISAFDVVMENGIPSKGVLLTLISVHWFKLLPTLVPGLRTHFQTLDLPPTIPASQRPFLQNRSMQVRALKIFPVEAICRGYITGSAWKEYQQKGTVHGMPVATGLQESQELPQGPIYTPSTKAEAGQHDENISPAEAAKLVGERYADRIEKLALDIYVAARDYARERGIIIADTKFEFGLDEETDEVVLVDEVLTPDSSRFWPADKYQLGRGQDSFDKQHLRDWLAREGLKGKDGVRMPENVAQETAAKYREVFEKLTGRTLEDAVREES